MSPEPKLHQGHCWRVTSFLIPSCICLELCPYLEKHCGKDTVVYRHIKRCFFMWSTLRSTFKINLRSLCCRPKAHLPMETKIQIEIFKENRSYLPRTRNHLVLFFPGLYWKWRRAREGTSKPQALRLWWDHSKFQRKSEHWNTQPGLLKVQCSQTLCVLVEKLEDNKLLWSKFFFFLAHCSYELTAPTPGLSTKLKIELICTQAD